MSRGGVAASSSAAALPDDVQKAPQTNAEDQGEHEAHRLDQGSGHATHHHSA
jgi:hypothetical protein